MNNHITIIEQSNNITANTQSNLPVVFNPGSGYLLSSDGTSFGIYANNDLLFENNTLTTESLDVSYINSISPSFPDLTIAATGIYLYGDIYANDEIVSVQGHTHDSGAITDFNIAVSGLLPSNLDRRISKAWINFNGTGTVSIRSSYNISALIDNNVGDYTIVFTTSMSNSNYSFVTWCRDYNSDSTVFNNLGASTASSKTSSSLSLIFNNTNNSINYDSSECNVIVFGD